MNRNGEKRGSIGAGTGRVRFALCRCAVRCALCAERPRPVNNCKLIRIEIESNCNYCFSISISIRERNSTL